MRSLSSLVSLSVFLVSCGASGPQRPLSARHIECGGEGSYVAEFKPGDSKNPVDNFQVTFTKQPTSADSEAALRRCVDAAAKTVRIDYETLVNAWVNDEGPLPLTDGSHGLTYDPKTKLVQTLNEREGIKPSETKRDGYTVVSEERKVVVPPYGKFVTMEVLFERVPEPAAITRILAAEVRTVVDLQPTKLKTTAYAKTGPTTDKVAQTQIRGPRGRFLSVEFDPKSGQMRDQDDRVLAPAK
jgi:hypothetical protein